MNDPFLKLTVELIRRLALLGVPPLSQQLYYYMLIRSGNSGLFWEAKAKAASVFGKERLSDKGRRDWFRRTVGPLINKGLVIKRRAGRRGKTAEYRVLNILDSKDPIFDRPLVNYARGWAIESGLNVDPALAEELYALYETPMTKVRFLRELEILANYDDQTLAVYGSVSYWRQQGLPFNGLAEDAMDWGAGPFAY